MWTRRTFSFFNPPSGLVLEKFWWRPQPDYSKWFELQEIEREKEMDEVLYIAKKKSKYIHIYIQRERGSSVRRLKERKRWTR